MGSLRWRRNRRFVALFATSTVALVVFFGNARISAVSSSERGPATSFVRQDIRGNGDLFDTSEVHDVRIDFDPAAYDRMLATFTQDGSKEYIEATVTIDGAVVSHAGVRLKGNSTLFAVAGVDDQSLVPEFARDPRIRRAFAGAEKPETLPWLIRFDAFIQGQVFRGLREVAVRPVAGGTYGLHEALALRLVAEAGAPSQRAAHATFSVNGSEPHIRLVVEAPGDVYAGRELGGRGVLYKALSTGQFAYLGGDPLAYADSFEQATRLNQQDLGPLIDLLHWEATADDETFAAELADRVDIEAFARYVAIQDAISNFDDMSGRGQNYYLWYSFDDERFMVLTWDLNLALTRPPGSEEGDTRPSPVPAPPGNQVMPAPPGNPLKQRFTDAAAFTPLLVNARQAAWKALYESGFAFAELEQIVAVLEGSGQVDPETLERDAQRLRATIQALADAGPPLD